jgi:DNA modification methylase
LEKNIIQCLQNLDRAEWAEAASRRTFNAGSVDFILTDPPYLVNYRDRSGRSIAGDGNGRGCSQLSPKCTASCSRVETARAAGAAA